MIRNWFNHFASAVSRYSGHPVAFIAACAIVLIWAATGPFVGYSDFWQLTINTSTTIITFLMVFIIQSSQNRDTAAMHVKVDELIRAVSGADNAMIDLEKMTDDQLEQFREKYEALAKRSRDRGDPDCE